MLNLIMNYRELGKTGIKVSEIGLGCEGFNGRDDKFTEEMFSLAFEHGVNCMDLYSPNPDMHRRIGNAIKDRRKDFILQAHLCTMWKDEQYKATRNLGEVKEAFETMLKNLGTDYIDIGMIHYVDSVDTWNDIVNNGIIDYAKELKVQGKIRSIGLSSHNPIAALEAVNSGLIEVLMFSINPCYDLLPGSEDCEELWSEKSYSKPLFNLDPKREELYEACQRLGVGITVMKVFGGGDLLSEKNSPAGKSMTAAQCIHYALTRPAVATIMYCVHCAHCVKGIDIATVNKFLNLSKAQGEVPETVREHYAALKAHASDCIECGACEKRCPFGVGIIENMREAKTMFGR